MYWPEPDALGTVEVQTPRGPERRRAIYRPAVRGVSRKARRCSPAMLPAPQPPYLVETLPGERVVFTIQGKIHISKGSAS